MTMVRRFSELFGVSRGNANLPAIAQAACREGYAVLPVEPGAKKPMCTLTPTQRKRADVEAANRAKDAGSPRWQHARHTCGVHHAITDPAEANKVFRRLLVAHPDLNLALEVGRSRMLCVDADNADDVTRFTQWWADETGFAPLAAVKPTVSSPGVHRGEEGWIHKDGGHFWFDLPEGVDFSQASTATALNLGGATVYFRDRVLLVPPSVREEGPYVLHSDIGMAPQCLVDAVTLHVEGHALRRERQRQKAQDDGDPIEVWAAETSWASLLEPDGWTSSHKFDSCQCEIWTRPGDYSSPKSATAHEPGCTSWDADDGNGFLHVWTDDPPDGVREYVEATGSKSLSKLQYVAWRDHGGDYSAAMRELDLARRVETFDPSDLIAPDSRETAGEFTPDALIAPGHSTPGVVVPEEDRAASWRPVDLADVLSDDYEPPEATVLRREDGPGLFYRGRVHWVQGEPESGKSWVVQLAAAQLISTEDSKIMSGTQSETVHSGLSGTLPPAETLDVLYLDYEQDAATVANRLRQIGGLPADIRARLIYLQPEVGPHSSVEAFEEWSRLIERPYALAVIDGVTDALGIDGKSIEDNGEVAQWMRRVGKVLARSAGSPAVVCVDHVTKDKDARGRYAIGAQAKLAGVDGAAYLVEPEEAMAPGMRGVLVLRVLKDRYGAIRRVAGAWRRSDRSQEAARVVFDGTAGDGRIRASVLPPDDEAAQPERFKPTALMERISRLLEDVSDDLSMNAIANGVTGKKETIIHALELLVVGGWVERGKRPGRGGGASYRSLEPYRQVSELIARGDHEEQV